MAETFCLMPLLLLPNHFHNVAELKARLRPDDSCLSRNRLSRSTKTLIIIDVYKYVCERDMSNYWLRVVLLRSQFKCEMVKRLLAFNAND